jgi:hypothetical protein
MSQNNKIGSKLGGTWHFSTHLDHCLTIERNLEVATKATWQNIEMNLVKSIVID